MIFDAGVFIKAESPSDARRVNAIMQALKDQGVVPLTNVGALAQVWRNPARQVGVTMLAKSCEIRELGNSQEIGRRCAGSGTSDVIDASLAVLSTTTGRNILTTDPNDMEQLGANHTTL